MNKSRLLLILVGLVIIYYTLRSKVKSSKPDVVWDAEMAKFAKMSMLAYHNYHGKNDKIKTMLEEDDHFTGYQIDPEHTTRDKIVLFSTHNDTKNAHVAYRGTQNVVDWKTNFQIPFFSSNSKRGVGRLNKHRDDLKDIIKKYGKDRVSVSGHSQGGFLSMQLASMFDLPGYHYNPALPLFTNYRPPSAPQKVYKTPGDFASVSTLYKKDNFEPVISQPKRKLPYTIVLPWFLSSAINIVRAHQLTNFT